MKKETIFTALSSWCRATVMPVMLLMMLIFSGCFGPEPEPEPPAKEDTPIEKVVKDAGPSVVNIYSNKSLGSGVIYKTKKGEGYIVTNDHVVRGANSLTVRLSDKRTLEAQKVGTDSRMDIAVIKVDGDDLQAAEFADSSQVKNGTEVIAIGNAHGSENSVTNGLISNANVKTSDFNNKNMNKYLQTSAAINPGNSGGALLNMQGQVIGINDMVMNNSDNMGFAIPSNEVKKIAEQLIDKGYVSWPYLGIDTGTEKLKDGTPVILVKEIMDNSPASKAGLKTGDLIFKVNDTQVTTVAELREQLNISGIDSMVSIYIWRANKQDIQKGTIQIKLEELPKGYYTIDWS